MRANTLAMTLSALLIACNGGGSDTDTDVDTDTGTDTDTDTGTGSGTDTDTGTGTETDTDTGTTQPAACNETPTTPAPDAFGSCYTQELECGQTYTHTLVGGTTTYDKATYTSWQCIGRYDLDDTYDGAERKYYFANPIGGIVTMTTECDSLALRVVPVSDEDDCPSTAAAPGWCETDDDVAVGVLNGNHMPPAAGAKPYMVIVDGIADVEGTYTLTVTCP